MPVTLRCNNCEKEYRVPPSAAKRTPEGHHFCSHHCYLEKVKWAEAKGENVGCATCGKEMWRSPYRLKRTKNHYCSMECLGQARAERPEEHAPNWRGGRRKEPAGYISVQASLVPSEFHVMLRNKKKNGGGDVLEHRLIMAQHLGRPLEVHEVVHHINGIKDDNRLENLELHSFHAHNGITMHERKEMNILKNGDELLIEKLNGIMLRLGILELRINNLESKVSEKESSFLTLPKE